MEGSLPEVSSTLSIWADQGLQSSLGGLKGKDSWWGSVLVIPPPRLRFRGIANKAHLWLQCTISGAKPELAQGARKN